MRDVTTRLGKFFFAALFLSFAALLLGCGSASAQERTYQITEVELTQLEDITQRFYANLEKFLKEEQDT